MTNGQGYFGKRIGSLSELQHEVRGEVYAVDSRTIHIRGFSYDGTAPGKFHNFPFGKSSTGKGSVCPEKMFNVDIPGRCSM